MAQAGEQTERTASGTRAVSPVAVVGFAAFQAFSFSLFYLGENWAFVFNGALFERAELFAVLLFVVLACRVTLRVSPKERNALLARPLLWCYAVLMVVGSFMPSVARDMQAMGLLAEGALVGVPMGLTLAAWGRVLGAQPISRSVPQVFAAFVAAALTCMVCALIPVEEARFALYVLPLVSAAALGVLLRDAAQIGAADSSSALSNEAFRLSARIGAGTFVFGLATGFMETYVSEPGAETAPTIAITLLFVALFCAAGLRSFKAGGKTDTARTGEEKPRPLPQILSRSHEVRQGEPDGPLDAAYRLAVLLMITGYLLVPVLGDYNVRGESIVLAGYIGLSAVLASLFLIVGAIEKGDTAVAFARGFAALFIGEALGVCFGNLLDAATEQTPYIVVAIAGFAALFSYLFLFTERDFRALSVAVEEGDRFDKACEEIVKTYGLSKREAEILPMALRGRTGERIASELFISKSTVDTHLRKLYGKCGVHSRQELIDLGERIQGGNA